MREISIHNTFITHRVTIRDASVFHKHDLITDTSYQRDEVRERDLFQNLHFRRRPSRLTCCVGRRVWRHASRRVSNRARAGVFCTNIFLRCEDEVALLCIL